MLPTRLRSLRRRPARLRLPAVPVMGAALVLACAAVLGGCASGSFLGTRYDNFTAYYNTYYNAKRSYDEAQRAMSRAPAALDRTRYLTVYPVADGRGQQQAFDAVIRRGADVLREHPDSKWSDDALLLIGKSYFALGQYVGAEQKFREILSLSVGKSRAGDLDAEARLWLARTLVAGGRTQAALDFLAETLARESTSRRLAARLNLVRADLDVQRASWDDAAEALTAALDGRALGDDALRARAAYLLGQVEATRGNADASIAAFSLAARLTTDFELGYAADVSALRLVTRDGNVDGALSTLRRLDRDDKYADRRAELALVRARLLSAAGRRDEAVRAFGDALYGDYRDRAGVRGRAFYGLADLYRSGFQDYTAAAVYYDSAASVLTVAPNAATLRLTPEAITDAAQRRTAFSAYALARRDIAAADSLLRLGRMDDSTFATTIRGYRQRLARDQEVADRERRRREEEAAFNGTLGGVGGTGALPPGKLDIINGTGGANAGAQPQSGSTSGFLFYLDPGRVRENRRAFVEIWGERPHVPNWRRREAITGTGSVQLAASIDRGVASPTGADDGLPTLDLSAIPRTLAQQDTVLARRAGARYRLGSVFLLNLEQPDSAAVYFRQIVSEDSLYGVAPRAFYALAEAQRALGDSLAAEALFRQALDRYPGLDFANRLRERFGQPAVGETRDTLDALRTAYADAYATWQSGDAAAPVDSAAAPGIAESDGSLSARDSLHVVRFLEIAAEARGTAVGAQALYAAAIAFQRTLAGDSLALATRALPADTTLLRRAGITATVPPPPTAAPAPGATAPEEDTPETPTIAPAVRSEEGESDALPTGERPVSAAPPAAVPPVAVRDTVALLAPPVLTAPPRPRLADLLQALVREYPNLPYGAQGQRMLLALTTAPTPGDRARTVTSAPDDAPRTPSDRPLRRGLVRGN